MAIAMLLLATATVCCFAAAGERALWTGWVPCLVMFGSMIGVTLAPDAGAGLLLFVPPLLVAAALAARGRAHRLMSVHRGLSLVAMAGLILVMTPSLGGRPSTSGALHGHGSAMTMGGVAGPALVLGGLLLTLVALAVFIARDLGGARLKHLKTGTRAARTGEVASMTAATVLILAHT